MRQEQETSRDLTVLRDSLRIFRAVARTLPAIDSKRVVLSFEQGKRTERSLRDALTEIVRDPA